MGRPKQQWNCMRCGELIESGRKGMASHECKILVNKSEFNQLEQQNKQLEKEIECLEAKVKNILTPYDESERLLVGLINERDQLQQQNIELKNRISELAGELTVQLANRLELESDWKDTSNRRLVNMTRDWYACANTNTELRIENTNLREKNKQLRDALRKCSPLTFNAAYRDYDCVFCQRRSGGVIDNCHTDDCEYIKLIKEDTNE